MKTVQLKVGEQEFMCQMKDCDYRNVKDNAIISSSDTIEVERACRVMFVQTMPERPGGPPGFGMMSRSLSASGYQGNMFVRISGIGLIIPVDEDSNLYRDYIKQTTDIALPSVKVNNIIK